MTVNTVHQVEQQHRTQVTLDRVKVTEVIHMRMAIIEEVIMEKEFTEEAAMMIFLLTVMLSTSPELTAGRRQTKKRWEKILHFPNVNVLYSWQLMKLD